MNPQVRSARPAEVEAATKVITGALMTDPGWTLAFPSRRLRHASLLGLARACARIAERSGGRVIVAEREDHLDGAAIWIPPGVFPLNVRTFLRGLAAFFDGAPRNPTLIAHTLRMVHGVESQFPADPVSYVSHLGVDPAAQRTGAGSALMEEMLVQGDALGPDTYLETLNGRNVDYYQRFGFADLLGARAVYPGGPPGWYLRRPRG